MKPPQFDYAAPSSLHEALTLLAATDGDAKPLAGGQSLMPVLAFRLASPRLLVDLRRIPDLDRIDIDANGVRLGAKVRWRDIERDARLKTALPLLAEAILHVAHYQIRNRGTVGGSLAHADPAAELPGIAVACDATIEIASVRGTRSVAADRFFEGALTTVLEPDELIVSITFPAWPSGRVGAFEELARRHGDFAMAGTAVWFDRAAVDGGARASNTHIGVIGASDRPRRLPAAEAVLNGRVVDATSIAETAHAAAQAVDPADDLHASAAYRRNLVEVLVERALIRAATPEQRTQRTEPV
ncbi:MAG: xanthine dehydrogenase family protein subunit M [Proteobacteria bacterium]|nr:xanthine dehydrogenase family protein subunit M [Burkholderiales bacterium]